MITSSSQFTPVKVKKILRQFQPYFREKLRKFRLRQKSGFLIKKIRVSHCPRFWYLEEILKSRVIIYGFTFKEDQQEGWIGRG